MNKKPLVSIVIPTHNRFELLQLAIQSVINQTLQDFEIIVSDNYSTDRTGQITREFSDSRIKYFRSEKKLSLGDSWEFALSNATGEYVGFLPDDDAYAKGFLETMLRLLDDNKADLAAAKTASFYSRPLKEYGRNIEPGSLVLLPFSRKSQVLDKGEAVELLFSRFNLMSNHGSASLDIFPQLVNTIYHSSLIKKVKDRVRTLMPIVGSDVYTAALFLNAADKYCYVEEPLYLHNTWEDSSTAGNQSMFEKYPEETQLDYVPLKKLLTAVNYGRNTILRARDDWGPGYHPMNIDWKKYFVTSFCEMKYLEASNVDVSAELSEFESVLDRQDKELQRQVQSEISNYSLTKTRMKLAMRKTKLGEIALKIRNRNVRVFSGFRNIAQCAESLDYSFLNRFSD